MFGTLTESCLVGIIVPSDREDTWVLTRGLFLPVRAVGAFDGRYVGAGVVLGRLMGTVLVPSLFASKRRFRREGGSIILSSAVLTVG